MFIIEKYNNWNNLISNKVDKLFTQDSFNALITLLDNEKLNLPLDEQGNLLIDDIINQDIRGSLSMLKFVDGSNAPYRAATIKNKDNTFIVIEYYESLDGLDLTIPDPTNQTTVKRRREQITNQI